MTAADELERWARALGDASRLIRAGAVRETRESAEDIRSAYRARARRDTGAMIRTTTIKATNGGLRVAVGPTAYYAVFQEEGTSYIQGDGAMRDSTDAEVPDWRGNLAKLADDAL